MQGDISDEFNRNFIMFKFTSSIMDLNDKIIKIIDDKYSLSNEQVQMLTNFFEQAILIIDDIIKEKEKEKNK